MSSLLFQPITWILSFIVGWYSTNGCRNIESRVIRRIYVGNHTCFRSTNSIWCAYFALEMVSVAIDIVSGCKNIWQHQLLLGLTLCLNRLIWSEWVAVLLVCLIIHCQVWSALFLWKVVLPIVISEWMLSYFQNDMVTFKIFLIISLITFFHKIWRSDCLISWSLISNRGCLFIRICN